MFYASFAEGGKMLKLDGERQGLLNEASGRVEKYETV